MIIFPLLVIIVLGIDYRRHTDWRCRIELLGLCVLVSALTWVVIPGLEWSYLGEAINESYLSGYTRLFSNEQYTMAISGAVLALVGLCLVLMWRAGRLARRYDTPAFQPDPDHPAVYSETKIS